MSFKSSSLPTPTIVVGIVVVVIVIVVVVVLIVVDNVDVVPEAGARYHDVDHGGEHEGEADVDHEGAQGEEGKDAGVAAPAQLNHLVVGKCEMWGIFKIGKSLDTFFRVFFFFFFFLWP